MKNIILACCFILTSFSLLSQTHLSFKIGGNVDYIEYTKLSKTQVNKPFAWVYAGGHFGINLDVPLYEDIISFSPDLQFLANALLDKSFKNVNVEIQAPLPFTCYITTTFGVDLGPSVSYRLVSLVKDQEDWASNNNFLGERLDFGVAGGVRFKLTDNAMIVGRYYFGLRKLSQVDTGIAPHAAYSRSGQISYIYSGSGRGY